MKSVSVFCASSLGVDPDFEMTAKQLGQTLAENNITLVYGGAKVGLMGAVADGALAKSGRVVGIIPRFLQTKEVAHAGLTELILCETMHERKMKMFERSEGFIALPGGFGTLEEVIEILTWQQLGLHFYPICFLNINGYYNDLKKLFNKMTEAQLLKPSYKNMALFADNISELITKMQEYKAPAFSKSITEART